MESKKYVEVRVLEAQPQIATRAGSAPTVRLRATFDMLLGEGADGFAVFHTELTRKVRQLSNVATGSSAVDIQLHKCHEPRDQLSALPARTIQDDLDWIAHIASMMYSTPGDNTTMFHIKAVMRPRVVLPYNAVSSQWNAKKVVAQTVVQKPAAAAAGGKSAKPRPPSTKSNEQSWSALWEEATPTTVHDQTAWTAEMKDAYRAYLEGTKVLCCDLLEILDLLCLCDRRGQAERKRRTREKLQVCAVFGLQYDYS